MLFKNLQVLSFSRWFFFFASVFLFASSIIKRKINELELARLVFCESGSKRGLLLIARQHSSKQPTRCSLVIAAYLVLHPADSFFNWAAAAREARFRWTELDLTGKNPSDSCLSNSLKRSSRAKYKKVTQISTFFY